MKHIKLKKYLSVFLSLAMMLSFIALPIPTVYAVAGDEHIYEGEDTASRTTNAPTVTNTETFTGGGNAISGGKYSKFEGGDVGQYVEYTVSNLSAGVYRLAWQFRVHNSSYCTVQVSVNGTNVGTPVTLNTSSTGGFDNQIMLKDLGDAQINSGNNTVRFTMTAKGAGSRITIDYFKLTELAGYTPVYQITGVPTDFITGNFTLPSSVHDTANNRDCSITWQSSNDGIISISGVNATMIQPEKDTGITLTATVATVMGNQTKTFHVSVLGSTPDLVPVGTEETRFNLTDLFTGGVYANVNSAPVTQAASGQGETVNHPFVKVVATAVGAKISFPVYVETAGDYVVSLMYRRHTSCGKFQVSVNGTNLGSIVEAGTISGQQGDNFNTKSEIGSVALNAGRNIITFTVVEAGASSGYNADLYDIYLKSDAPEPADYSDVTAAIGEIPANYKTLYTEETVNALDSVIENIDYTLTIEDQDLVDGYAEEIRNAIAALIYRDADYSAVIAAAARLPVSGDDYTIESYAAAVAAVNAVEYDLKITEQARVDKFAQDINTAINHLIAKTVEMKLSITEGMISEGSTEGKYNVTWNARILVGEDTSFDVINTSGIKFKEYGVYYAASTAVLSDYQNAAPSDIRNVVFDQGEDIDVYSMFGFRLKNISENKTRSAMFYIEYEYDGHSYILLSTVSETLVILAD